MAIGLHKEGWDNENSSVVGELWDGIYSLDARVLYAGADPTKAWAIQRKT